MCQKLRNNFWHIKRPISKLNLFDLYGWNNAARPGLRASALSGRAAFRSFGPSAFKSDPCKPARAPKAQKVTLASLQEPQKHKK